MKIEKVIAYIGLAMSLFFVIAGLGMSEHLVLTLVEDGRELQTAINSFVFFIFFFVVMGFGAATVLMQKGIPKGYTQDEYDFCKENNIPIR